VLRAKDNYNRAMFRHRHGYDLFTDRERYHAVLCNSHLIPSATRQESRRGIEEFAPVVRDAVLAVMSADAGDMAELRAMHPREIHSIRGIPASVA
jgi:cytidylate kinase